MGFAKDFVAGQLIMASKHENIQVGLRVSDISDMEQLSRNFSLARQFDLGLLPGGHAALIIKRF